MKSKIFVYLAKRDKKEIKVLGILNNNKKCHPTKIKIEKINEINLPNEIINSIKEEYKKNKLIWEIYLESSDSYEELKKSLIRRGYKNLPLHQITLNIIKSQINEKIFEENKTMLRKKSQSKTT